MLSTLAAVTLLNNSARVAHADDPVIDATRLLSLSSPEVLAMGGAGIGFAAGASGVFFQPGAPANRKVESVAPVTGSFALNQLRIPKGLPADVGNLGRAGPWSGEMTNLALSGSYHNAGIGLAIGSLSYAGDGRKVVVSEGHFVGGGAVWDGRIGFGAGGRLLTLDATLPDAGSAHYVGTGLETGLSFNQLGGRWNIGAVVRSSVRAEVVAQPTGADGEGLVGLAGVAVPWQVAVGAGWHNNGEGRERPVRVAADLVVDGPVENGVSLEASLSGATGADATRGQRTSFTPHVGVEATAIPDRLHLRAGAYVEPGRASGGARPHATTGFELRLFHLDLFGLASIDVSWEAAVDVAPRYLNVGWLGIGLWQSGVVGTGWHPRKGR